MVSVLRPATVDDVADALRTARADGSTVEIRGAGTKASWGGVLSPVDIVVDTRRLRGVLEHEPGDLVATVSAGSLLGDVQAVLALTGQRIAVESGWPGATIGGLLATGEAGPSRMRFGAGRDLLIGARFVRADGVAARSGGKVVKNVAGYDLGRLLCGSYGTLAVLTAATFRLHPLPATRAWVSRAIAGPDELARLVPAARAPSVNPTAIEVDLRGGAGTLAVLVEGSARGVQQRAATAAALLGDAAVAGSPPPWWGRYPFEPADVALKIAVGAGRLPAVLTTVRAAAGADLAVRGSAGAGVVHVALPAGVEPAHLAEVVRAVRSTIGSSPGAGSCVVLVAPAPARAAVDSWGPVPGLELMRRVKQQFDPQGRFAAGRFVGGI